MKEDSMRTFANSSPFYQMQKPLNSLPKPKQRLPESFEYSQNPLKSSRYDEEDVGDFCCAALDGTQWFIVMISREDVYQKKYKVNRLTAGKIIVVEDAVYLSREKAEEHALKCRDLVNEAWSISLEAYSP